MNFATQKRIARRITTPKGREREAQRLAQAWPAGRFEVHASKSPTKHGKPTRIAPLVATSDGRKLVRLVKAKQRA